MFKVKIQQTILRLSFRRQFLHLTSKDSMWLSIGITNRLRILWVSCPLLLSQEKVYLIWSGSFVKWVRLQREKSSLKRTCLSALFLKLRSLRVTVQQLMSFLSTESLKLEILLLSRVLMVLSKPILELCWHLSPWKKWELRENISIIIKSRAQWVSRFQPPGLTTQLLVLNSLNAQILKKSKMLLIRLREIS